MGLGQNSTSQSMKSLIRQIQLCQPDIELSGLTAGKTSLRAKKNLPVMTFALREQTLTNITQGVRNHLTWEKEPAHPPARRETSPQEANSKETYPKVKGNNTATATHCEASAAGAATKHQRRTHRQCDCSTAQLPREGMRRQKAQGAQTVRVGNLRHTWP